MTEIYFSINLILIVTHLYGGLIRLAYRPRAYAKNFEHYFPAYKLVVFFYWMQIMELPYLLNISNPAALFYANTFDALFLPAILVPIINRYFFRQSEGIGRIFLRLLPVAGVVSFLFPYAFGWLPFTENVRTVAFWVVCVEFLCYLVVLLLNRVKMERKIRLVNEMTYSNESDFPLRFASNVKWFPLSCSLFCFVFFLLDSQPAKMVHDALFIGVSVTFLLYVLEPHWGKGEESQLPQSKQPAIRMSDGRRQELEDQLVDLLRNQKIFTQPNLKMDEVARLLKTNRSYLSETIQYGQWKSFYTLVNSFRIEYVLQQMQQHPEMKMETLSIDAGFASASFFSQIFKKLKGVPPSEYLKNQEVPNK